MAKVTIHVFTIDCDSCLRSVTRSVSRAAGVNAVEANRSRRSITVDYDPSIIEPLAIRQRIENAGFPTEVAPLL